MGEKRDVRVTFTLSEQAHGRLKSLAEAKGGSMAEIFREALRREVWLESVLNDDDVELLLRHEDRPDELQRIMRI